MANEESFTIVENKAKSLKQIAKDMKEEAKKERKEVIEKQENS